MLANLNKKRGKNLKSIISSKKIIKNIVKSRILGGFYLNFYQKNAKIKTSTEPLTTNQLFKKS